MVATVEDGRLTALRPDEDHPLSSGFACQKGIAFTEVVNDPDRVTTPLRRRARADGLRPTGPPQAGGTPTSEGGFEPVGWDEAMADIADRVAGIHRRHGSGAIGWYYGNPGAFSYSHTLSLTTLMLGFGPRLHVFTAGSQDVNNRFVASQLLYGTPLALPVPDVLRTDLLVVMGANPVVSHGSVLTVPRIRDRMHDVVKRGGRVLVVDPRRTETAAQFEWLGIVPDGDAHLLLSLLHVMFGENFVERARLARQADGAVWLERLARPFSPDATAELTGIEPDTVRALACDLVRTERAAVYGRVGTSIGENGTLTTYLLDAVNLVAGNLDVPGGSMFGRYGLPGAAGPHTRRRRGGGRHRRRRPRADRVAPRRDRAAGGRHRGHRRRRGRRPPRLGPPGHRRVAGGQQCRRRERQPADVQATLPTSRASREWRG